MQESFHAFDHGIDGVDGQLLYVWVDSEIWSLPDGEAMKALRHARDHTARWLLGLSWLTSARTKELRHIQPPHRRVRRSLAEMSQNPYATDDDKAFAARMLMRVSGSIKARWMRRHCTAGERISIRKTSATARRIVSRDKGMCRYCGAAVDGRHEIDHVVPISLGGSNADENLALACEPCNNRKSGMLPEEAVMPLLPVPT